MTCPTCHTRYAASGEPNCWCETGQPRLVLGEPVPIPQRPSYLRPVRLDWHDIPIVSATKPSADLPHHHTTEQQLADLVDVVANLELRLMTRTPGVEQVRTKKRRPEDSAPVNVGVLHALDTRVRYQGDEMLRYLDDERARCRHDDHGAEECPWERDDAGRQGVLPDLWVWARMMEADLMEADPKLPEELPDPATMATVCSWLAEHYQRWSEHFPREAAEFAKDVQGWHNRLRAELGEHDPPTLRHTNIGGCGDVLAQLADGVQYECRGCRDVLTLPEMLGLARWQADVTLREAHEMLGVPMVTLKRWAAARTITPTRTRKPALYSLREIQHERERRASG